MEILKHNWKLKLLAFIIAVFLWTYVIGLENPTLTKNYRGVSIVIQEDDDLLDGDYTIISQNPQTIDIQLSGKRNALNSVNNNDIYAYIDLARVSEGPVEREIKFQLPNGLTVNNSSSSTVSLQIEKNINKDIDVSVDSINNIKDGYIIESMSPSPKKITAVGARSQIDKIDRILAGVDVSNLDSDQMVNVNVKAVDKDGNEVKNITLGQSFVNVALRVSKTKEVPIKLSTVNETLEDIKIRKMSLVPETVYIKGKKEDVDRISNVETETVDLALIEEGSKNLRLVMPDGISLLNNDIKVRLDILLENITKKEIKLENPKINIRGLSSGLEAKIENMSKEVIVSVEAFESQLKDINKDSIKLSVDLTNKSRGAGNFKLIYDRSEDLKDVKIYPESVRVVITKKN